MSVFYRFRDITIRCSKIANFLYPTCTQRHARSAWPLWIYARSFYIVEIYEHRAIVLSLLVWVYFHSRLS